MKIMGIIQKRFIKFIIKKIKKEIPEATLRTTLIVGFPGETEEEFNETYKFLEKIKLTKTHVFKYSPRKGTKAADMGDQIDGNIKEKRSKLLIELSNKNEKEFIEKFIGKEMDVLIENEVKGKDGVYEGYTRNYIKVQVPCTCADVTGKIVDIEIEKAENEYGIAKLL